MHYSLTPQEREDLAALALRVETGEISVRRLAVEAILSRRLVAEVRRIYPANLRAISPDAHKALGRIPLQSEKPGWESLTSPHFEQPDLIK